MAVIVERQRIESIANEIDLLPLIEQGFVAYSEGRSVVPPVGELHLDKGEVHIKYGFIREQPYYVIKIASGFYGNTELGLSTSDGCMLLFCQNTGQLKGVLLDEGYLTDVRTAVAGAIAAKHLAPKRVSRIGIVGSGIQAFLQLQYLAPVIDCRDVLVWGRSAPNVLSFMQRVRESNFGSNKNFRICFVDATSKLQAECNLIITTTPTESPLLHAADVRPGTHITAVGSDTPKKQELDTEILRMANTVVADSKEQCKIRGEISQAIRAGNFSIQNVKELGNLISGKTQGRTSDEQITVADLTGVAVQDIQIATAVFDAASNF